MADLGFKHYSASVNLRQVSDEVSGKVLEVTFREFVAKQKLFNRYTLTKTLGRGGMGVVWLARDDELERDVALKFLPELIIHDRAVLSDLKRETRRSLELTHKNIIRIYDFVYDQTSACISMEYVDGDTLSNLRADKPRKVFEPAELKGWVSQLCDALDYAHNHPRIVHRDLKPANLMVNQRGDLKVSDFGIARSLSDSLSKLTMQHGRSGTLVYMSPQQLDGERGDHLDDVYSLGASVYELLTSKPPFYSGNVDRQIREKIPPTMTQRRKELEIEGEPIDAVWEKVVAACLAKDPTRRPQSVAEIASLLDVLPPKIVLAGDARAKLSKKTALACAIVALCLAATAGWFFAIYQPGQKRHREASTAAPSPIPTAAAKPGAVTVNTWPEGATVTLGGLYVEKSPATFKDIRPGKYPMRMFLDGYDTIEKEVEVKSNEFADLGTITLQRSKGINESTTVPPGASTLQGETPTVPQPTTKSALNTIPFTTSDQTPAPSASPEIAGSNSATEYGPSGENGRTWQGWIGEFVRQFVSVNQLKDADATLAFYAPSVDYFDDGGKDQAYVRSDIEKYNERWPIRRDSIEGDIHLQEKVPDKEYAASFKLNFYAESVPRAVSTKGQFAIDLDISIVDGIPRISGIKEKMLHQQKGKPNAAMPNSPTPANRPRYPYGISVPGRPGFVKSPYAPSKGLVDVRRYRKGVAVKCPFTGKIFITP